MKKNNLILIIIAIAIVGAGAFFGGMKFQESQRPANRSGNFQGARNSFQQRNQGSRPVSGEIISQDDKSIILKLQDGGSKIVLLSDKTTINKASTGTKSDLKTGERVAVFGTENSDGSITSQIISIGGMFRNGFGGTPSAPPKP